MDTYSSIEASDESNETNHMLQDLSKDVITWKLVQSFPQSMHVLEDFVSNIVFKLDPEQ